jgi:formylglycine-generating enzyme required for sulfatase activity
MKLNCTIYIFFIFIHCSCFKKEKPEEISQRNYITAIPKEDSSFSLTQRLLPINKMVLIDKGRYNPLYGKKGNQVIVESFLMDVYPVTNQEYLEFVKSNSKWKKSAVKEIFADGNYLNSWNGDTILGISKNSPVTNISWFAAKAYCECLNKRLPFVDEWEYVAMADESVKDARNKKSFNQYLLNWYEKPNTFKNEIGNAYKNYWGVYDVHGLIWEWTADFNSILMSGENRSGVTENKSLFCGSGSLSTTDLMNYAAFMRYAFRGSLKANYTIQNLGFRCAKSLK